MSVRRLFSTVFVAVLAAGVLLPALAGDARPSAAQKKDGKPGSKASRTLIVGPGNQAALDSADRAQKARKEQAAKKGGKASQAGSGAAGQGGVPATAARPSTGALPRAKSPAVLATRVDKGSGDEVLVITNDDLTRIYGRTARPPAAAEPDYGSLLEKYGSDQQAAAPRPPRETREQKIASLQQKIAHLQRRVLSLHNPYLPRIGPDDDKERQAEKGMDNVQRVKRVQDEIRRLQQQLERLQKGAQKQR
ncbi:MAG TPA: hypothetical protein ENK10_08570 [Acidobacteria bacterium]|nr:hypothetical protein [Acidobacteriota bacterium]